ncbi:hypothetical protein M3Y99_00065000 [Aphelenchoides fujianensis]|nr:hypothetical protein M3Y99_00065000 [Aphelenchoides fujianensis]
MTVEHFRSLPNDTSGFFECSTLAEEERKEYGIDGKYLGLWTKAVVSEGSRLRCGQTALPGEEEAPQTAGRLFGQSGLRLDATPIIEDPRIGIPCTWQQSRLYNDPSNNSGFLQCIATSTSDPCGEWSRVECPAATTFELTIQICAPLFIQQKPVADVLGACSASNEVAVCRCGAISQGCPGISTCRICAGSGSYPVSSCSVPCPPQYNCQPAVGCCPVILMPATSAPATTTAASKMILVQLTTCPGSSTPPIGSCGSCPSGYSCAPLLGACCPAPAPPPPPPPTTAAPAPQPVILLCPTGTPASQPCTTTPSCPTGNVCYQGGCCPCQCPPQAVPVTYCPQMTPPAAAAPSCQCSTGQECSNGGCCPIPFCPSGVQAAGHCASNGGTACQVGMICLEGLCCPLPQCTNGQPAASFCTTSAACNPGSECQNGGCCNIPIPLCPSGAIALAPCPPSCSGSTAVECCPSGYQCVNGGCCALPTCPTTCCPLPLCPSGLEL